MAINTCQRKQLYVITSYSIHYTKLYDGLGTLLIAKPVTDLGQQFHNGQINDPAKGWFYVLAASIILAVIACLNQRFVAPVLERATDKWASKKLGNLWLPVGSLAAVAVIVALFLGTNLKHVLPGNIGESYNFV